MHESNGSVPLTVLATRCVRGTTQDARGGLILLAKHPLVTSIVVALTKRVSNCRSCPKIILTFPGPSFFFFFSLLFFFFFFIFFFFFFFSLLFFFSFSTLLFHLTSAGIQSPSALFEESLARHGVGSYHPGEMVRM